MARLGLVRRGRSGLIWDIGTRREEQGEQVLQGIANNAGESQHQEDRIYLGVGRGRTLTLTSFCPPSHPSTVKPRQTRCNIRYFSRIGLEA